jgi:hypothetical protein
MLRNTQHELGVVEVVTGWKANVLTIGIRINKI